MRLSLALLAFAALSSNIACSAAPEDEALAVDSEAELRTLTAAELAGDITYGTSAMEVQHPGESTSRRTYRAVRFQGTAGDEIDASVIGGNAARPVLYLLGDRFQTIASNDVAAPNDGVHVTRRLTRTGTYYLAFRTKEGWRTKFYVSLRKANGAVEPPPPPPPPVATWRTALAGADRFGVVFDGAISTSTSAIGIYCRISVSAASIRCASNGYDYNGATAAIQDDGSFAVNTRTNQARAGDELKGSINADGSVTLTRFAHYECFQTSSFWCEGREADGATMPRRANAFELCRTPDQHFYQGGWASGYYLACSACNGQCENGR